MTGPGRAIESMVRRHPAQAVATTAAIATFGALSAVRDDARFWAYLVVVTILAAIVAIVDGRFRLGTPTMWLLAALAALHLAGGLLPPVAGPTFYETWLIEGVLKFDQAVHLFGSAVVTLVAWEALGRPQARARARFATAASIGFGLGILNEGIELVLGGNLAGVFPGGPANSAWDVVFNVAGIAAVAMFAGRAAGVPQARLRFTRAGASRARGATHP